MSKWRKTPPRPIQAKSSRSGQRQIEVRVGGSNTPEQNVKALAQFLKINPPTRRRS